MENNDYLCINSVYDQGYDLYYRCQTRSYRTKTLVQKKPINKPQLLIRLTEWAKHPAHRYEEDAGHPCFTVTVTSSI